MGKNFSIDISSTVNLTWKLVYYNVVYMAKNIMAFKIEERKGQ